MTGTHASAWWSSQGSASLVDARRQLLTALTSTPNDLNLLDLERRLRAARVPQPIPTRLQSAALDAALREAAAAQRQRAGAVIARSWQGTAHTAQDETLVIAFAGADAVGRGAAVHGAVPSHEFVASCRRAGVRFGLFVRDPLRAWYLRGLGASQPPGAAGDADGNFAAVVLGPEPEPVP